MLLTSGRERKREVDQRKQAIEGKDKYTKSLSLLVRPKVVLCGWKDDSDQNYQGMRTEDDGEDAKRGAILYLTEGASHQQLCSEWRTLVARLILLYLGPGFVYFPQLFASVVPGRTSCKQGVPLLFINHYYFTNITEESK